MSALLSKALEGLGLEPGQTYRATVEGHEVEVRVLAEDDEPTPELAEQVMLNVIANVPPQGPVYHVKAKPGKIPLSPPPEIPPEDEEEFFP